MNSLHQSTQTKTKKINAGNSENGTPKPVFDIPEEKITTETDGMDVYKNGVLTEKLTAHQTYTDEKKTTYTHYAGETCEHCDYGVLVDTISFSGKVSEFFVHCPACNTYYFRYKPMPHQAEFHLDEHMKKLYAGGFGSAKTYTGGAEAIAHALQVPNGASLVGAATWGQTKDTCLKFMEDNIPKELVAKSNQDKVSWFIELSNGHRISARALDKEGKIRSANLTFFWGEEASEIPYSIIVYIQARLRNKAGFVNGVNRIKMILTSNPDVGWLRTQWLMKSNKIVYHGEVPERYNVPLRDRNFSICTHIASTSVNYYLPPDYIPKLIRDKEDWWIKRYIYGSFSYTEGLVFPNFMEWLVDPFVIPSHWRRIVGIDFGRNDPTVVIVGAVQPYKGVIYWYKMFYKPLGEEDIITAIDGYRGIMKDFRENVLLYPPQADPRGKNRDQVSGESWFGAFAQYDIHLDAPDMGKHSIAPSIAKVNAYGKAGKMKFFKNLHPAINEFTKYKYKSRELGDDRAQGEVPTEANNHVPDAIRYAMSKLPINPDELLNMEEFKKGIVNDNRQNYLHNPLSNDYNEGEDDGIINAMDNFL